MLTNNINHISCPRLGCGLDGLSWSVVKSHIEEVFRYDNITIDIYYK